MNANVTAITRKTGGDSLLEFANRFTQTSPQPKWLTYMRRDAKAEFARLGLPARRMEEWRETDLGPLAETAFGVASEDAEVPAPAPIPGLDAHRVVLVDGRFHPELSKIDVLPRGVAIKSLAAAFKTHEGLTREHIGAHAEFWGDAFTALNTAALDDGVFIHVPSGVALDKPVHVSVLSSSCDLAAVSTPRVLAIAGESASFEVIEQHRGLDGSVYLGASVTEIVCGAQSRVRHYFVEQDSRAAFNVSTLAVSQNAQSDFASHTVLLGGRIVRNNVRPSLWGEGAMSLLNGLYLPTGEAVMDNHMRVHHSAPGCPSRQYYTGLIRDRARGVFIGRIIVDRAAQKTDAVQASRNLLLSDDARAHNRPQLEIFADDVKCTHGSTTGALDAEPLFYLRSRGIPEDHARSMLIYAQARESIERIELAPLREWLDGIVANELGLSGELREGPFEKGLLPRSPSP